MPSLTTEPPEKFHHKFRGHIRRRFLVGILLIIPIVATYLVLGFVFRFLNGLLESVLTRVTGSVVPGAGLVALIVVVYLLGMIVTHKLGRYLVVRSQKAILRLPVVNTVYQATKQLVETLSGTDAATGEFRSSAVLIELPPGSQCFALGFKTGSTVDMPTGERLAVVYIVTPPTPQSGWMAVVAEKHVYNTNLNAGEAMRLTMSGGVLTPETIRMWKSSEALPSRP